MHSVFHKKTSPPAPQTLLVLVLSLAIPYASLASGDWVLEKRFNEQMILAKEGDTQAMYEVGRMYERGRGVKEDLPTAINLFLKAAHAGSDSAHARLGMLYSTGLGTKKDYAKAHSHLSIAAKNGIPAAQYYLARMFEKGNGIKQNYTTALALYKKAAEGGFYQASASIAQLQKAQKMALRLKQVRKTKLAMLTKKNSAPSRPKKTTANTLKRDLAAAVLSGNWQRNGHAAGYLPSSGTKCKKKDATTYRCRSQTLTKKIEDTTVIYVTVATLSGLDQSGQFKVIYRNNILQVHKDGEQLAEDDEEDYSTVATPINAKLNSEITRTKQTLQCSLRKNKTLVCVDNLSKELKFKNNSSS